MRSERLRKWIPGVLLAIAAGWLAGCPAIEPGDMINLRAATFVMGQREGGEPNGNGDEMPRHTVHLSAYAIGKYAVTNAQYAAALNWAIEQGYLQNRDGQPYAGGDVYAGGQMLIDLAPFDYDGLYCAIQFKDGAFIVEPRDELSMDNHPVVNVTWFGCAAYCNWMSRAAGLAPCYDETTWERFEPVRNGYRLPTEAEWEYAAAWDPAATPPRWIYGCRTDKLDKSRANYDKANPLQLKQYPFTTPVGYYNGINKNTVDSPSPAGCYDMTGNVWNWVEDRYGPYSPQEQTNPAGPATGDHRVLRGGGWAMKDRDCRVSYRIYNVPDDWYYSFGFRVARSR